MKRTLYWDAKEAQFVYILWDGSRAKHHKLPRTIVDEKEAKKYIRLEKLNG